MTDAKTQAPAQGGNELPQSRTAYVAERIKEDLASGVIGPGGTIKQTVLAKRYGVSPTPVREALRILQSDGIIDYSPHKGASVRELTPEAAQDLYRIRAGVEQAAAQMGVERMTPEGLARLEDRFNELTDLIEDEEATPVQLSLANRAFHFALYEQSSPLIVQYLEILWARFTPKSTVFRDQEVAKQLHQEHRALLEAVHRRDPVAAGEIALAHTLGAAAARQKMPAIRAAGKEATF